MKRYIVNRDDTQTPPAGTRARAEIVSGLLDFHKKGNRILEAKDPYTYPLANKIIVHQGSLFTLFNNEWRSFEIDQEVELGAAFITAMSGASRQFVTAWFLSLPKVKNLILPAFGSGTSLPALSRTAFGIYITVRFVPPKA